MIDMDYLRNAVRLPPIRVPDALAYDCDDAAVARAATLRNAIFLISKYVNGVEIHGDDPPWHASYNYQGMVEALLREGYLNPTVH